MNLRTIVVIPTYNEAQCIEKLILQIIYFQPKFDILIVDDNSPDGTAAIVEKLVEKFNNIKLLRRSKKSGLGGAYVKGFTYALLQKPPYARIVQMDADFSHHPKYLNDLVNAVGDKDISIGSRYVPFGKALEWKLYRKVLSYAANVFVSLWLNLAVKDCTSGFRCFHRDVLNKVKLETFRSNGYLFQVELLVRCIRLGCSFKEIPITFIERKTGRTKLGGKDIWEAMANVFSLKF